LVNFILISIYLWHLQINNISVDDQFNIYRYFGLNDLNLINLFILVAIEISFYTWSFLSYKSNLSDWIVPKPQKGDVIHFLNIFIFYFFISYLLLITYLNVSNSPIAQKNIPYYLLGPLTLFSPRGSSLLDTLHRGLPQRIDSLEESLAFHQHFYLQEPC